MVLLETQSIACANKTGKISRRLLERFSGSWSGTPLRPIPAFYPVPDGEIIFADYLALTDTGKFARLVRNLHLKFEPLLTRSSLT